MKKIRLDLSHLKVESFVTGEGMTLRGGTVFGMNPDTVCEWTCDEVSETCMAIGCAYSGNCNFTVHVDQGGSCIGDPTVPPPTTLCSEVTCPETPETCDGHECHPD